MPDSPMDPSTLTSPLQPTTSQTPLMTQSTTSPVTVPPATTSQPTMTTTTPTPADAEEMATKPSPTVVPEPPTPKVNLRILVISGQTKVFSFEPSTTIGRVKELIWNMWPSDWTKEPCLPPSPSYFRVLYLGRVLDDEADLATLNFKLEPAVTIVHLAVRTFPIDEEPIKKSILSNLLRPPTSRQNSIITALPTAHLNPTPVASRRNTSNNGNNGAEGRGVRQQEEGVGGCKCVIM